MTSQNDKRTSGRDRNLGHRSVDAAPRPLLTAPELVRRPYWLASWRFENNQPAWAITKGVYRQLGLPVWALEENKRHRVHNLSSFSSLFFFRWVSSLSWPLLGLVVVWFCYLRETRDLKKMGKTGCMDGRQGGCISGMDAHWWLRCM